MRKKLQMLWVLVIGFSSCYYDVEDELYIVNDCDIPVEVSFAENANPIIQQSCALSGCHVSTNSDRVNMETYETIIESIDNGSFQSYVFDNLSMPPAGPLADCNIEILKKWIDNGALNN